MALFSAFPAPDSFDPEQSTMAYLMAVEDLPPEHIASAVKRFIRAEVSRPAHRFLPTAAELALEARRLRDEAGHRAYLALPKPKEELSKPKTAEEREKVAALMESLALGLKGHKKAMAYSRLNDDALREIEKPSGNFANLTISPAALARVGIETKEANA
jgi:hypothetical protein